MDQMKEGEKMRKRTFSVLTWVVAGLLILTACSGVGLSSLNLTTANQSSTVATPTAVSPAQAAVSSTPGNDLLAAYQGTLENIYTTVSPSVVNIHVVLSGNGNSAATQIPGFPFFNQPQGGQPQQQLQSALGSGFVWDTNGDIVTNNHVVSGANKIDVTFSDGDRKSVV